jgi:hypothetical protein
MGIALLGSLPSAATAQVVGVPGSATTAPSQAAGAPPTPVAPAAPASQNNLWAFLCLTPWQKAACKEKFCTSMFGQLINNGLAGPSTLTGGVIPQCCPVVNATDLLKDPDSAEGAAARIKQDEADAKKRRAAVRYLGTVDCNFWPEARDALVNSLRADKNECVRFEAAMALSRGCCCNRATILALTYTVSGSTADGNPAESCERVKMAASMALAHCLDCFVEVVPAPVKPVQELPAPRQEEKPKGETTPSSAKRAPIQPITYRDQSAQIDSQTLIRNARMALAGGQFSMPTAQGPTASPASGGLVDLISGAFAERGTSTPSSAPAPVAVPRRTQPVVPASSPAAPQRTFLEVIREKFSGPKEQTTIQPVRGTVISYPSATGSTAPVVPATPPAFVPPQVPRPTPVPMAVPVSAVTPAVSVEQPRLPANAVVKTPEYQLPPAYPVSAVTPAYSVEQPRPPASAVVKASQPQALTPAYSVEQPRPQFYLAAAAVAPPMVYRPAVHETPGTWANSPGTVDSTTIAQCLHEIRRSPDPFQKERAVRLLGGVKGPEYASVVRVLLETATRDEAPLVRAACLRSLVVLKVRGEQMKQVVRQCESDKDPRVQIAAREARDWLRADGGTMASTQPVRLLQQ